MKDILKCIGLLTVGLFVAVMVYPFLHEAGHLIIAIFVGAEIVEFNLLPLPFVICDVRGIAEWEQSMIGMGGIAIPFVTAAFIRMKNFWAWYALFLVKGISLYAAAFSLITAILHTYGINVDNDDIVQILKIFPNGVWVVIIVLGLMIMCSIIVMKKEKPFLRCLNYFDITENEAMLNQ